VSASCRLEQRHREVVFLADAAAGELVTRDPQWMNQLITVAMLGTIAFDRTVRMQDQGLFTVFTVPHDQQYPDRV